MSVSNNTFFYRYVNLNNFGSAVDFVNKKKYLEASREFLIGVGKVGVIAVTLFVLYRQINWLTSPSELENRRQGPSEDELPSQDNENIEHENAGSETETPVYTVERAMLDRCRNKVSDMCRSAFNFAGPENADGTAKEMRDRTCNTIVKEAYGLCYELIDENYRCELTIPYEQLEKPGIDILAQTHQGNGRWFWRKMNSFEVPGDWSKLSTGERIISVKLEAKDSQYNVRGWGSAGTILPSEVKPGTTILPSAMLCNECLSQ